MSFSPLFGKKFAPTDLANLGVWLDASDLATITKDGSDQVSNWADKSGNSNDAANATEAQQPDYRASGINGLPAIDFTTGHLLTITDAASLNYTTISLFVVFKRDADAGATQIILRKWVDGSAEEFAIQIDATDTLILSTSADGSANINSGIGGPSWPSAVDDVSRITSCYDGTNQKINTNQGVSDTDAQSGIFNGAADLFLGAGGAGLGSPALGRIGEFIMYTTRLNAEQEAKVEQYLDRKWKVLVF